MEGATLSEKVSGMILADIHKGVFDPARRLPGYRELSARYKTSWGTVIEALGRLERGEVLERRARSGTYLSPRFLETRTATRSIAFLFPEREISLGLLDGENWAADSEIFLGLIGEAQNLNARVDFKHIDDSDDPDVLSCQERQLRGYDAYVMIGLQLEGLRMRLRAAGKTVVVAGHHESSEKGCCAGMTVSSRMLRIGHFIEACKYRFVSIVRGPPEEVDADLKESLLSECLAERGIAVREAFRVRVKGVSADEVVAKANRFLDGVDHELVVNFRTDFMPVLFQTAMRRNMVPGKEFDLLGMGSGMTYANYYPPISYFRPPCFEMGKAACRMALGLEYSKRLELEFIQGQTTKPPQNKKIRNSK